MSFASSETGGQAEAGSGRPSDGRGGADGPVAVMAVLSHGVGVLCRHVGLFFFLVTSR